MSENRETLAKVLAKILVIVDPTATRHPAVDKGCLLAERFGARLDLFVCETKAARNQRQAARLADSRQAPGQDDARQVLETLARTARDRGVDVTTELISADPLHVALLNRVKHTCADLVIKDTHRHTLAQRTFLTNTDWELIRGCPVPLLLVKPGTWSPAHRIGAAVDPGHLDDKPRQLDRCILEHAAELAQRLDGELHVIHAYIPAAMLTAAAAAVPPVVVDLPVETLERERQAKLADIANLVSATFPTNSSLRPKNIHVQTGSVGEVLCRVARECEIDIMAMGAVARSGLKRILIGSTAEQVLERLPCDLLVVKTPNFAELLPL